MDKTNPNKQEHDPKGILVDIRARSLTTNPPAVDKTTTTPIKDFNQHVVTSYSEAPLAEKVPKLESPVLRDIIRKLVIDEQVLKAMEHNDTGLTTNQTNKQGYHDRKLPTITGAVLKTRSDPDLLTKRKTYTTNLNKSSSSPDCLGELSIIKTPPKTSLRPEHVPRRERNDVTLRRFTISSPNTGTVSKAPSANLYDVAEVATHEEDQHNIASSRSNLSVQSMIDTVPGSRTKGAIPKTSASLNDLPTRKIPKEPSRAHLRRLTLSIPFVMNATESSVAVTPIASTNPSLKTILKPELTRQDRQEEASIAGSGDITVPKSPEEEICDASALETVPTTSSSLDNLPKSNRKNKTRLRWSVETEQMYQNGIRKLSRGVQAEEVPSENRKGTNWWKPACVVTCVILVAIVFFLFKDYFISLSVK